MAEILAENGVRLVYGGGSLGLMGALANSVLDHGGEVTGVIPEFLTARERKLTRAQELIVTRDMHERKQIMFERADAFVALPGGIGTLEETIEQMTWAQLGRHQKPILLANIGGFWDPLCVLLDHMRALRVHPPRADDRAAGRRSRRGHPAAAAGGGRRGAGGRRSRGRAEHRADVAPSFRRRFSLKQGN